MKKRCRTSEVKGTRDRRESEGGSEVKGKKEISEVREKDRKKEIN